MAKIVKKRHWGFVVYPESAPKDWRERLQQTGLKCAISPLHDKDFDPTGEAKKPHWHVIACWEGPAAYTVAKALTDKLRAPIPQALESVKGYYRYLTHKDNPDKHQYDESQIQHLGGFDPLDFMEWTRSELEQYKREIMQMIRDADVVEYCDLLDMLADSEAYSLLSVAMSQTMLFRGYIESRRHKRKAETEPLDKGERFDADKEAAANRDEIYGKRDE